jgi:diguanylate cyclase (GGDEF)-like protein/PAS domain S-box-containing protein
VDLAGDAEMERVASLRRTGLLDSWPESAYDTIVEMACEIVGVPIALVSLVDSDRQWFKAKVGLSVEETSREVSFCSHAIEWPTEPCVVGDARSDPRFHTNPLVTGDPGIRFYAGFPLLDDAGRGLGTLCVIDRVPRELSAVEMAKLRAVADLAQELMRLRTMANDLENARRRAQLFERGFDISGVGKLLVGLDGRIVRANRAFAEMIGWVHADLIGRHWREVGRPNFSGQDFKLESRTDDSGGLFRRGIGSFRCVDERVVWAVVHLVPVTFDDAAQPTTYVEVTNITDTIEAQQLAELANAALHRSERRLASLIDPAPDPVVLISDRGIIEAMNPAAIRALSPKGVSLVGCHSSTLALAADVYDTLRECVVDALRTSRERELAQLWFETVDGSPGWYRLRVIPVPEQSDGGRSVFVSAVNITKAVRNEQRLATLALLDPLTGAANRSALHDRLEHALARIDRDGSDGVAVAMIDLDHFKALNDTYGHDAGDAALVALVTSLNSVVRAGDTVARIGGDEFVVMFDGVDERHVTEILAPRLIEQFEHLSVPLPGGVARLTGSVGVVWSSKRLPRRDLLARADAALFQAKRHGRNRLWIAGDVTTAGPFASDGEFRRELAAALERQQFCLHYQPIVDRKGDMTAVEALLRWEHPEHGTLLPVAFLGELIASGAVASVGRWALRQAFIDAVWFNEFSPTRIAVHVNLSPGEIASSKLGALLRDLLLEFPIDPALLVIEVTEEALMGTVVSPAAIDAVASTGVKLALDDFGTGSSSLTHLRRRPLHGLKLDRSFVVGIGHDETDMAILSSIIGLARTLGLDVVAEGVETNEQADWLAKQHCTHFQGWLTGRPVPRDRVFALRIDTTATSGAAGG